LQKALGKKPSDRFPSVQAFADSLRRAAGSAPTHSLGPPSSADVNPDSTLGKALLETVLQRLGTSGPVLATGPLAAPTSSLMYGAAGVAYLFYRLACLRDDPRLLVTADLWSNRALKERASPEAFHDASWDIPEKDVGPASLYFGLSGLYFVQALVAHALGDMDTARTAVKEFLAASRSPCGNPDLTMGRASALMGCAALREALPSSFGMDRDRSDLWDFGQEIVTSTWSVLDTYEPIRDCKSLTYLGIAHGWAGLLFVTLRWCQATRTAPPGTLLTRLHELAGCARLVGGAASWTRHNAHAPDGQDTWVGWCNGSAGHVFLWNQAFEVFRDSRFQRLAESAAQHTWIAAGQSGNDLCCGLGGRTYALLNMYRCSGDRAWLERAQALAQRAFGDAALGKTRLNSLYKGDGGLALLAAELEHPASACLPIFEPEGWPAQP